MRLLILYSLVGSAQWLHAHSVVHDLFEVSLVQISNIIHTSGNISSHSLGRDVEVLNTANRDKINSWFKQHAATDANITYISSSTSASAREVLHAPSLHLMNIQVVVITVMAAVLGAGLGKAVPKHAPECVMLLGVGFQIASFFLSSIRHRVAMFFPDVAQMERALKLPVPPKVVLSFDISMNPDVVVTTGASSVKYLWFTGSKFGSACYALGCFFVPLMFVISLLGYLFMVRSAKSANFWHTAVQVLAKWCCPSLVCHLLTYHLLRKQHRPPFVESLQTFDVGLTCQIAFTLLVLIPSPFLRYPWPFPEASDNPQPPRIMGLLGIQGLRVLVICLVAVWTTLFALGLILPCIAMEIDEKLVLERQSVQMGFPTGVLELGLRFLGVDIRGMWGQESSFLQALRNYWEWAARGRELNVLFSALLLTTFCLVTTLSGILLLLLIALRLGSMGKSDSCSCDGEGMNTLKRGIQERRLLAAMECARVLKQYSMFAMVACGIAGAGAAAKIYRQFGMFVYLRSGIIVIFLAEIVYYLIFWTVKTAVAGHLAGAIKPS